MTKYQKDPTCCVFLKRGLFKDIKMIFPRVKCKCKNTNTQIHHMTRCQKDPTCVIFLKRGLFKDIKNDISINQTCKYKNTNTQIHKYTNTAYDKVPESPNMLYIFEKRIVQGYKK